MQRSESINETIECAPRRHPRYNSAFLHLESDGKSLYGHSSGEGGSFAARGVPPGEYLLFIKMRGSSYDKTRKYYYPGTFLHEEAVRIKVGLGEAVEGLKFHLPDEFRVQRIEGQVVWEDGKPAEKIEVGLYCPRSQNPDGFTVVFVPKSAVTDEQGRFQLESLTTETYWMEARGLKTDGDKVSTSVHSPPSKVTPGSDIRNINENPQTGKSLA